MFRHVTHLQKATATQDGAGVKLKRVFPAPGLDQVDPFLLLDHFGSDKAEDFVAGFPMHPHRGMETVTYMLAGEVAHKDSAGHSGSIGAGDVQWMSAGRGILHEEMPKAEAGTLNGMQLWVNLPAKDKMQPAAYQEYLAENITQFSSQGHHIKLISGDLLGHEGQVKGISTEPVYADITLVAGDLTLTLPAGHNAFVYVLEGEIRIADTAVHPHTLAVLSLGETLTLSASDKAQIILAAGKPIGEPVVRSGPFVMNTEAEIKQTWAEIRAGTFPPV